jgi:ubiquitin carboxyl-terminal hydrolase 4/11/15
MLYDLYAVSNHYGGLGGGHYTAYAKHGGSWFEFDDARVREVSPKNVVSPAAYILCYKRREPSS